MHKQFVAGLHRGHELDLDGAPRTGIVDAQGEPAGFVDAQDLHRDAVVAAGDAMVGVAVAHSITLAFSSSSSCSYSAPMRSSSSRVARASSSSTAEIAKPT